MVSTGDSDAGAGAAWCGVVWCGVGRVWCECGAGPTDLFELSCYGHYKLWPLG